MSGECSKCNEHTLECTCKPYSRRQENGWIRTKDILPCVGTRVLFCCEQEVDIGYFFEELGWKFLDGGDWFEIKNPVTHWMPLPEPPAEFVEE